MKKILYLFIVCCLLITGCGMNKTASGAVTDYLELYTTLDSSVTDQLNEQLEKEEMTDEQKETYKEVMKKQYSSLNYEVINETINGNEAYVTVRVNVIDLYNSQQEAAKYFNEHKEEFNDEQGVYSKEKYMTYKLDRMKNETKTITHTIEFKAIKNGDIWEVTQLSTEDLEKIHRIYNSVE